MGLMDLFKQELDKDKKNQTLLTDAPVPAPMPTPVVQDVAPPEQDYEVMRQDSNRRKRNVGYADGFATMFGADIGAENTKADIDKSLANFRTGQQDKYTKDRTAEKDKQEQSRYDYTRGRQETQDNRVGQEFDSKMDPNHPSAKTLRTIVARKLFQDIKDPTERQALMGDLEGMGAADLSKINSAGLSASQQAMLAAQGRRMDQSDKRAELRERSIVNREDRTELAKARYGWQKVQKFEDDARNTLKDMRGTDTWKTAEKTLAEIPNMKILLEDAYEKGGQSLAMLGPKVAKGIAGEVGVLTDKDVIRYTNNPALIPGIIDTLERLRAGSISADSYDNLSRLLEISKQAAADKMDKAILREAILFSRRERISLSEARHFIDEQYHNYVPEQEASLEDSQQPPTQFPREVRNPKTGEVAEVADENELAEAQEAGFQ